MNRCMTAGCSNTPSSRVSLCKFHSDPTLRRKLEKQVQQMQAQWKASEHSLLCSDHFTEDCFEVDSVLVSQFGIKKRRWLKPELFQQCSTDHPRETLMEIPVEPAQDPELHSISVQTCPSTRNVRIQVVPKTNCKGMCHLVQQS